MADINSYAAFTPVSADKMLGTDDPSGTPLTRNSTVLALLGAIEFGSISVTGASATQSPGAAYALMTMFAVDGDSSAGVTPAVASNKITLTETGHYLVIVNLSLENSTAELTSMRVYWNAVAQTQLTAVHDVNDVDEEFQMTIMGTVDVTTGATDIDLRAIAPAGALKLREGSFTVIRIGNT